MQADTYGMSTLTVILLLAAAICFLLAALRPTYKVELIAFGLLAWVLTLLLPALQLALR